MLKESYYLILEFTVKERYSNIVVSSPVARIFEGGLLFFIGGAAAVCD